MSPRLGVCLIFLFTSSACTFGVPIGERGQTASTPPVTLSGQGNPTSYVVHGRRYFVMEQAQGFKQRGIASWYGRKFHGRKTSSGEVYNMHAMTAAHKTLPIPVYVHVRNLDNGRATVVRVNDRGPFIEGRVIDLSFAAAKKLGVTLAGTANVEITVVEAGQTEPESVVRTVPLADPLELDLPMFIQMGSFANPVNAHNLMQNLISANESAIVISRLETDEGLYYRVRVGPLYDIDEANAIVRRLRDKGFQGARIVVQDETE